MDMSLLGLCSTLFLETVVFLQNLCVYFNKINPEGRGGLLTACHLVKLCLLGEQVWQYLHGIKQIVFPGGAVMSYGQ